MFDKEEILMRRIGSILMSKITDIYQKFLFGK